jgi:hypothetical protein
VSKVVAVAGQQNIAIRIEADAALRAHGRLCRRQAAVPGGVLLPGARRTEARQLGHDSRRGINHVDDAVDVIGNKDIPERVHLHATPSRCAKDAIDGQASVSECIRGHNASR